jgi:tRNA-specific 2-thiouridylase
VAYFTIGQRHGLGIHSPSALYVVALDAVRASDDHLVADDLLCSEIRVGQVNPITTDALETSGRVLVKIRYAHAAVAATLDPVTTGLLRVRFDEAQRAVAPGQAAVFYDVGDPEVVLGGGTILGPESPAA